MSSYIVRAPDTTGGPAFPLCGDEGRASQEGMTLRDYFAAQALSGLVVGRRESTETLANEAYAIADAMLASRKQTG